MVYYDHVKEEAIFGTLRVGSAVSGSAGTEAGQDTCDPFLSLQQLCSQYGYSHLQVIKVGLQRVSY